jgi:regulator of CtrA degradation
MIEISTQSNEPGAAITSFASSEMFERLFRDGMNLVEETAAYLDGEGRAESKQLDRATALAYAAESMRLTTRLMQAASWLLVQRAVREGEMTVVEAGDAKYRLGAKEVCQSTGEFTDTLPARLQDLLARSERVYERVKRFDDSMFTEVDEDAANPVADQIARLQGALLSGLSAR